MAKYYELVGSVYTWGKYQDQEVVKQKKLCQTCGHDFVAKYVDPEGEVLTIDKKVTKHHQ